MQWWWGQATSLSCEQRSAKSRGSCRPQAVPAAERSGEETSACHASWPDGRPRRRTSPRTNTSASCVVSGNPWTTATIFPISRYSTPCFPGPVSRTPGRRSRSDVLRARVLADEAIRARRIANAAGPVKRCEAGRTQRSAAEGTCVSGWGSTPTGPARGRAGPNTKRPRSATLISGARAIPAGAPMATVGGNPAKDP